MRTIARWCTVCSDALTLGQTLVSHTCPELLQYNAKPCNARRCNTTQPSTRWCSARQCNANRSVKDKAGHAEPPGWSIERQAVTFFAHHHSGLVVRLRLGVSTRSSALRKYNEIPPPQSMLADMLACAVHKLLAAFSRATCCFVALADSAAHLRGQIPQRGNAQQPPQEIRLLMPLGAGGCSYV